MPELRPSYIAAIAAKLQNKVTIAILRLSNLKFLCCYSTYAVYVNKHKDISRSVIIEYVGKARRACLKGDLLIFFND